MRSTTRFSAISSLAAFTGPYFHLPGSELLRNARPAGACLTTKPHPDCAIERLKARYCVDGSIKKPGEYDDVCAHVAQLSTFQTQVAATALGFSVFGRAPPRASEREPQRQRKDSPTPPPRFYSRGKGPATVASIQKPMAQPAVHNNERPRARAPWQATGCACRRPSVCSARARPGGARPPPSGSTHHLSICKACTAPNLHRSQFGELSRVVQCFHQT
jgi:hypothetical protein